jgi:hypothetical protein
MWSFVVLFSVFFPQKKAYLRRAFAIGWGYVMLALNKKIKICFPGLFATGTPPFIYAERLMQAGVILARSTRASANTSFSLARVLFMPSVP